MRISNWPEACEFHFLPIRNSQFEIRNLYCPVSPGGKQPTLAALAEEAGVSRMTVSRVLRNARYTAPETRERVLAAAKKLNYQPNPMVAALMTYVRGGHSEKRVGVLAYLTSSPTRAGWRQHQGYVGFYRGAFQKAEHLGYRLEEFWLNDPEISVARLNRILYAQGICGLIVAPMGRAHGHLKMDWAKFTSVAIGHSLLRPDLTRAVCDQFQSILLALRSLRRLGYRRIGLAMSAAEDARVHYHWSAGYLSFHQRQGITDFPAPHLPQTWDRRTFVDWVRRERVDAVVSTHEELPWRLGDVGLRVPEDIGYAHLDLLERKGQFAGIDQQPEEIGAAAVELVAGQLNRNEMGLPARARVLTLPGVWVDGGTVRRVG
jgi:DNA-binding LacI/PurR family transcriptional regulator